MRCFFQCHIAYRTGKIVVQTAVALAKAAVDHGQLSGI